jgi:hypothetical protein
MVFSMRFLLVLMMHALGPGVPPAAAGVGPPPHFVAGPLPWLQNPAPQHRAQPPGPAAGPPAHKKWRYLFHKTPGHPLHMLTREEMQMPAGQPRRICVSLFCFSFDDLPDIADSPKLYFSGTADEATRRCCYRHYHESVSAGQQTMFRLDMQHARFRNMHFAGLFGNYATVDTPVDVFFYDILANGSCEITMCPGASDCNTCYHACVCVFAHHY